jgi:hypothetical protein
MNSPPIEKDSKSFSDVQELRIKSIGIIRIDILFPI